MYYIFVSGWAGDTCNVNICQWKTCLNEGKCVAGQCLCKADFTGELCEYEIGACESKYVLLEMFNQTNGWNEDTEITLVCNDRNSC